MKSAIKLLLVCLLVNIFSPVGFANAAEISVTVNDKPVPVENVHMYNDRTLILPEEVMGSLGASFWYFDTKKCMTVHYGDFSIEFFDNSSTARVNDKDVEMDTAAKIIDGNFFVPLRFICETIGASVSWDEATNAISVTTQKIPHNTTLTSGIPNVLENPTDHRPVPTEFEKSNRPDDLLYFPMPGKGDDAFAKLEGGELLLNAEDLFTDNTTEGMPEYGTYEVVEVEDMPFDKAIRLKTTTVPIHDWMLNYRIYPNIDDYYEDNDILLVKVYARLVNGGNFDTRTGKIGITWGECTHTLNGGGAGTASSVSGEWNAVYFPFKTNHAFGKAGNFLSFMASEYEQEVEIGGLEFYNFGKKYDMMQMPSTRGYYKGYEEDAQWRKDALDKIEKVRKGDIEIIVRDKNGNLVTDADVKLDMYEHEMIFSSTLNTKTLMRIEPYRERLVENFNGTGEGIFHRDYTDQKQKPEYARVKNTIEWAKANGLSKNFKGHSLIWDTGARNQEPNKEHYLNTGVMVGPYLAYLDDKEALDNEVYSHLKWMSENFPDVTDWDVSNEDSSRISREELNTFKNIYGKEVLINWYKYARELFPNANLCLTDGFGVSTMFDQVQKPFLDWAVENLDFDTIGNQGHIGYITTPEDIIENLNVLSSYGKPIRITEFDSGDITEDQNYQANITRDALIAYFSCENVEMIEFWEFYDFSETPTFRLLCDHHYNLKPSGKVYQDLVYNKWWTRESGKTDKNGSFSTRGFYGDYTVKVTKDGQTTAVDVPFRKGTDNKLELTLDI